MIDELRVCAAALFLNKGRDVMTAKEFTMYVSLDLRWMASKYSDHLVDLMLSKRVLEKKGEYLRPAFDISDVDVPVAYRPSEELLKLLGQIVGLADSPIKKGAVSDGILPKLIGVAAASGMEKGKFVSECNKVGKKLNVDIEVAALFILKERGADISGYIGEVTSLVLSK